MDERWLDLGAGELAYVSGEHCPDKLVSAIEQACRPVDGVLVVLDRSASAHATAVIQRLREFTRVSTYVVDAAERNKTLSLVESIMDFAVDQRLTRDSAVVSMGGGLVCNLAGLAAALLYRGVRLVHLPTTPIAAFDAVLSCKQGVNLRTGKNLCGTYLTPTLVACDLAWIATVPPRQLLTGLAEMAKNVLTVAPHREDDLLQAIDLIPTDLHRALRALLDIGITAKVPLLRQDPYERRAALVFEYGHTVGHALEFGSEGLIGHGEAVAWGMLVAAEVGRLLGMLDEPDVDTHYRLVSHLQLPNRDRVREFDGLALTRWLASDNKRGGYGPGSVPMVLLAGVGQPLLGADRRPLTAVPLDVVLSAWSTVVRSAGCTLAA